MIHGETRTRSVRKAFPREAWEREPESEITLTGAVLFDPEDGIYTDHFPGNPVVPGTLIIKAFLQAAERLEIKRPSSVENVRFLKFIPPGEYRFRVKHLDDRVACELFDRDNTLATGTVRL